MQYSKQKRRACIKRISYKIFMYPPFSKYLEARMDSVWLELLPVTQDEKGRKGMNHLLDIL